MRTLGLDIGDRRIGVALSDPAGILASAFTVIERKDDEIDFKAILDIVKEYKVGRIVVGLPRSLDGSTGKQAEKAKAFSKALLERAQIHVEMWDERLSTLAAERLLREAGKKRGQIKGCRDAAAAAFILQGYLDSLASSSHP